VGFEPFGRIPSGARSLLFLFVSFLVSHNHVDILNVDIISFSLSKLVINPDYEAGEEIPYQNVNYYVSITLKIA
jgi:hypothetical protein